MYASVWTWDIVADKVRTLSGRLGFPPGDSLQLIGLKLSLKDGKLYDLYLLKERPDLAPNIYFVLYRYAHAEQEKPETGKLISFRQIYGGDIYYKPFENSVLKVLDREFSSNIDMLVEVAKMLGAEEVKISDYDSGLKIRVLPLVPIYLAIDLGDEEFPPLVTLFYDESIKEYFSAEEVSHLSEALTIRLVELARELGT